MPRPMLKHGENGFFRDSRGVSAKSRNRTCGCLSRNAAQPKQVCDATNCVGTPTEAEQEDAVAQLVVIEDESVTICYVSRDAAAFYRGEGPSAKSVLGRSGPWRR